MWQSVFGGLEPLGSFVGLVTGIFVAIDWVLRQRPIAYLRIARDKALHIKNTASVDIFIRGIKVRPDIFRVARGHSVADTAASLADGEIVATLKPGEERAFPLMDRGTGTPFMDAPKQRFKIEIYWRRGDATWRRQLPVTVKSSTDDVRDMALAAD